MTMGARHHQQSQVQVQVQRQQQQQQQQEQQQQQRDRVKYVAAEPRIPACSEGAPIVTLQVRSLLSTPSLPAVGKCESC